MRNLMHACLLAALCGSGAADADGAAATLADLRWDYRVIAVFMPTDTAAAEARATIEREVGIEERDIAWFVVAPTTFVSNLDRPMDRAAIGDLHRSDGFETVLVGKDGGVKARQTEELDLSALFEAIDAMPMRQNEMRSGR